MTEIYDVIVVGSGITGGWAAKEFCEKGFKTLVIERGRNVEHRGPEYSDMQAPWDIQNRNLLPESFGEDARYTNIQGKGFFKGATQQFFTDDSEHPISYPEDRPVRWVRSYQLGGRSLTWGRQSLRWGPKDFEANAKDGYGIAWPIGYEDLAPWYDYVESFVGISANKDDIDVLPNGVFQKPWEMSCAERFISDNLAKAYTDRRLIIGRAANITEPTQEQKELGRGQCQARSYCQRGCTFGAYFSSLSATLPAAKRTGNLTVVTDAIVTKVNYDEKAKRASGVTVIDSNTKQERHYHARVVFLCASAFASVQILLNSKSKYFPNGIANSSGALGHYIMDHFTGVLTNAVVPGFEDRVAFGRRPIATYIPNYRHEQYEGIDFVRGYGYQATAQQRRNTGTNASSQGLGKTAKDKSRQDSVWRFITIMFGEMLPYYENRASLHPSKKDQWGIPLLHVDAEIKTNERKMIKQAAIDIQEMLEVAGCTDISIDQVPDNHHIQIGDRIHEMGGACMGSDPKTSVLNKWAQSHDVDNLFVTDGACMSSCATQNPSLTYMAITARAADYAAKLLKSGTI
ncbi:GMC oxidoreductase [Glaciecola sp. SC05]|uniref:GMC oxidoreductase n=1 Tax=Glaciecola sp. SC05 TaxID=1987355 RepID=UPI003528A236